MSWEIQITLDPAVRWENRIVLPENHPVDGLLGFNELI
jgi:hypothetical protein